MADSKIELRSEKVRHIIGEIPTRIVRYGITTITIVILGLLVSAYFIPYPEIVSAKVQVENVNQVTIAVPYKYVNKITRGMKVKIEIEGYDVETYGVVDGIVVATSHMPQKTETGNVFKMHIKVTDCKYELVCGMVGTAYVLTSNENVLQRIFRYFDFMRKAN